MDGIRDEIAVLAVHGERPEGAHGRDLFFGEMQRVAMRAIKRLAGRVLLAMEVGGVFGRKRAEADASYRGARGVVGAVASDDAAESAPAVAGAAADVGLGWICQSFRCGGRAFFEGFALFRGERVEVERLAGLEADAREIAHERGVFGMRVILFE